MWNHFGTLAPRQATYFWGTGSWGMDKDYGRTLSKQFFEGLNVVCLSKCVGETTLNCSCCQKSSCKVGFSPSSLHIFWVRIITGRRKQINLVMFFPWHSLLHQILVYDLVLGCCTFFCDRWLAYFICLHGLWWAITWVVDMTFFHMTKVNHFGAEN